MAGYDTTSPGDSDIVSQFPANERAQRSAVASAQALEHDTAGAGRHKFGMGNTSARDAITTAHWNHGSIFIMTSATSSTPIIQAWHSADAAWKDTGRFTSADEVKLDAVISADEVTSAEAIEGTVTSVRAFTPAKVKSAVVAGTSAVTSATSELTSAMPERIKGVDYQDSGGTDNSVSDVKVFYGQSVGSAGGDTTITFPSAFTGVHGICGNPLDTTGNPSKFIVFNSLGNSNVKARIWDHSGTGQSGTFSWWAWGV